MSEQPRFLTAAQTAQRLGLTVKALRVLERHQLVEPGRTAAGWRVYGPDEFARLHQVLALRRLGLTLAEVARLLCGRVADLDRTLAVQEEALLCTKAEADRALRLIREARTRLAAGESLSTDDLANLIKETIVMTEPQQPSPELRALIERHYTPKQLEQLKARPFTTEDQTRVSAAWASIYEETGRLMEIGADPGSPEALSLALRSRDLIAEFTGGDPGIAASLNNLVREASSSLETAHAMPGSPKLNAFLAEARSRLASMEAEIPRAVE